MCCFWLVKRYLQNQNGLLYPHHKMWGGGLFWIRFVPSVGRSVRPSTIRVRSITPLLMEGFPSNLNDMCRAHVADVSAQGQGHS